MDTAVDTTVLTILGSAFGVMFATMITLLFVTIRVQHRDSTGIRSLIERSNLENRDLIEQSRQENRELIEQSRQENREMIRETQRTLVKIADSLADARERLARLEGHVLGDIAASPRLGGADSGTAAEIQSI